jgi:acetyl esterase/lipase
MKSARFLFVLAVSVICMLSTGYSQTRTRTRQPDPTTANSVSWITNVPYVTGGGPQQQLDLYIPTNEWGEPLVVFVHGGGWAHGDKAGDSINPNNLDLLWDGYAMASINYRLAPGALWPAQIEDCKAAIRWLKAHANDYGYDPNRLGVIGESAGGHLVAMLGATTGQAKFDVGENLNVTSDVNCVIDLFGVSDFSFLPNVAAVLLGPDKKSDPDLVKSISPVTYVHEDEPPMLIVHGDVDKLAPYEQATRCAPAQANTQSRLRRLRIRTATSSSKDRPIAETVLKVLILAPFGSVPILQLLQLLQDLACEPRIPVKLLWRPQGLGARAFPTRT